MIKEMAGSYKIAVTGHRFIPNAPQLDDSIRQVFREFLITQQPQTVCLISALAEGSDQLVARISLEFQWISRCVPLPKPEDAYLEDFFSDAGKESFQKLLSTADRILYLSPPDQSQSDYEYLGNYLVKQADALIALWNGVYNQKKGGTGEVVKAARKASKPVYWIYCPNQKPGAEFSPILNKQIGDLELLLPNN